MPNKVVALHYVAEQYDSFNFYIMFNKKLFFLHSFEYFDDTIISIIIYEDY